MISVKTFKNLPVKISTSLKLIPDTPHFTLKRLVTTGQLELGCIIERWQLKTKMILFGFGLAVMLNMTSLSRELLN